MMRCMRRTNIYLDEMQCIALDRLAKVEGTSRAEIVRRMIDRGLSGGDDDLDADLAAIRDSAGALTSEAFRPMPRGDDARNRHLEALWNRAADR